MKFKVILKDRTYGEIECNNFNNAPKAAWKKYGDNWDFINDKEI